MRSLVVGGAGFVGSNLVDALLAEGDTVTVVDSMITSNEGNLDWAISRGARVVRRAAEDLDSVSIDEQQRIFHLGSPASPPAYQEAPIATLRAGSVATLKLLELAEQCEASFVMASTSEVYGDPLEHPQTERYWGNVNPIGPRSMYDEAKRFSEAATMVYSRRGVKTHIARIFNTYGPRMNPNDGRLVPNFVKQALNGADVTVYGDGEQTRSLCYVDDLVDGLMRLSMSSYRLPVNLGNPDEQTVQNLAELIVELADSKSKLVFRDRPEDDPERRRPDITRARRLLNWEPATTLTDGMAEMIEWARSERW